MEALDLSIGIKSQKKIEIFGWPDSKGCQAKKEEAEIKNIEEQPDEETANFPYSTFLAKNLIEKDPNLDFMDQNRKKKTYRALFVRSKSSARERGETSKI
jgi:hypothetical protein